MLICLRERHSQRRAINRTGTHNSLAELYPCNDERRHSSCRNKGYHQTHEARKTLCSVVRGKPNVHGTTYSADDDLPGDFRRREIGNGGRCVNGSNADGRSPLADAAGDEEFVAPGGARQARGKRARLHRHKLLPGRNAPVH